MTEEDPDLIYFPAGMQAAMDGGPGPSLPAGSYLVVVTKAENKRKNAADQVFVELSAIMPDGARKKLATDVLTFSDGAMGIAAKKLIGLSIDTSKPYFRVSELLGKVARAYVKSEPWVDRNGNSRPGLKVDIYQGTHNGFDQMPQPAPPTQTTMVMPPGGVGYADPEEGATPF